MADSQQDFIYYHYRPTLVGATVLCVIFAASSALHAYQLIRTRAWYIIPLLIGAVIEAIGYGGRIGSAIEAPNYTLGPYIIQALLILIAPALMAATVYMVLGYIILAVDGERHSMIRQKFLTKIFVLGDIFSFMVQSTGAGLLTKKDKDAPITGKWIIIGGLALQLMFFGFFMVVSVVFYARNSKQPTQRSKSGEVPWRLHMWVLFTASVLIMLRSVFRVAEYVQGTDGYLLSHEIYLYIFDAALMCGVVLLFNIVHPSQITGLLTGRGAVSKVVKVEQTQKLAGIEDEEKRGSDSSEEPHTAAPGQTEYTHNQLCVADFRSS